MRLPKLSVIACLLLAFVLSPAFSQKIDRRHPPHHHPPHDHWPPVVIIPPARPRPMPQVQITSVKADVSVKGQIATTHIDVHLKNPGSRMQEAVVVMPVPDGVSVRGFDFAGSGKEPTAVLMRREEARRIYNEIVSKMKDPAILEFAGLNLIRSSVFPVEPNGTQRVTLIYEQVLTADGNRVDFFLPRSESLSYNIPWEIKVTLKAEKDVSTVYSPSHNITAKRVSPTHLEITLPEKESREPGPFRLSYLLAKEDISASLMAYPDPKVKGGYFLLLAGLPSDLKQKELEEKVKREVTLVIDRSGSMRGDKIKQAQEAALQVVAGLKNGEAFNIITYNEGIDFFKSAPVIKNAETMKEVENYIKDLTARGGTNIHDALVEALRQKPADPKMLPIVLFLTDGVPTIGQTAEKAIRLAAKNGNAHNRRIFSFGVGVDVNTPLLDRISDDSRGTATYVLPKENVEVKVGSVFKRLYGPVLAEPTMAVIDENGNPAPAIVEDLIPIKLPDMFFGDQLVMLGKYKVEKPLKFKLDGTYLGDKREFQFDFALDKATTANSFVPRLWASRKIAILIQAIRDMGAEPGLAVPRDNPKLKELVDEVVKLSLEFGILTEYTAYLAREGTDLAMAPEALRMEAEVAMADKALGARSGMSSVTQSMNAGRMKEAKTLNRRNVYYNEKMEEVEADSIQQINDLSFYKRKGRWIDSRVATDKEAAVKADRTVTFGTEAFDKLLDRLITLNRQGSIALGGDVMIELDGENVLVTGF